MIDGLPLSIINHQSILSSQPYLEQDHRAAPIQTIVAAARA
jgi:hypothetical protein